MPLCAYSSGTNRVHADGGGAGRVRILHILQQEGPPPSPPSPTAAGAALTSTCRRLDCCLACFPRRKGAARRPRLDQGLKQPSLWFPPIAPSPVCAWWGCIGDPTHSQTVRGSRVWREQDQGAAAAQPQHNPRLHGQGASAAPATPTAHSHYLYSCASFAAR